jgi:catechol 2,3-dioxygenase-like lactoylglutathione lyase family enzyme
MSQPVRSSRDIVIRTSRWAEALRFYEKVLGFPIVHRGEAIVGFDTGSITLYVENGDDHGPVLDFLTHDVQAMKDRCVAAGCEVFEENPAVPRCYVRDPFGLAFNLGHAQD